MPREDEKQFLLLAKSVKRAALATLIHQVLMSTYLGNCWGCLTLESWLRGTLLPHCSCWWRFLAGHMLTTKLKLRIFPYSLRLRRISLTPINHQPGCQRQVYPICNTVAACILQNMWHLEGPVCRHASPSSTTRGWRLISRHQDLIIQI